jgi:hypothetical protein
MQSERARQRKWERKRLEREAKRKELRSVLPADEHAVQVLGRGNRAWISLGAERRPRERGP